MLQSAKSNSTERKHGKGSDEPDLQTQFEAMLDQVWRSEADWRLFDRIDAFCAHEPDRCGALPAPEWRG